MPIDLTKHTAVRWKDTDPKFVPLLREANITAVIGPPDEGFAKACADAGITTFPEKDLEAPDPEAALKSKPSHSVVIKGGLWPGVQRPDPQVASATQSMWLDQNCSLIHYLRTLLPRTPLVLGYQPDEEGGVKPNQLVSLDALELALVESRVSGGNYLLALPPRLRQGLVDGTPEALTAWRRLGRTAKWLRDNQSLFGRPALPIITVLVDESEVSLEVANLAFRQNVSPALAAAANPPAPHPERSILAAVNIETPKGPARDRIMANAAAGATLIVDGRAQNAWWSVPGLKLVRSDTERDYYSAGKIRIVAYREGVGDPGMFALDLIDLVSQKRRPARVWNCNAGIVIASAGVVTVINYGRTIDIPVLARIQGSYKRATLLRPETDTREMKVAPRGTSTEVSIPGIERVATVVFS